MIIRRSSIELYGMLVGYDKLLNYVHRNSGAKKDSEVLIALAGNFLIQLGRYKDQVPVRKRAKLSCFEESKDLARAIMEESRREVERKRRMEETSRLRGRISLED